MRSFIAIFAALFIFSATSNAQFKGDWLLKFSSQEQTIHLEQEGERVWGKLVTGENFSGTWDQDKNKFLGWFRFERKIYQFNGFFKSKSKMDMVVGKYLAAGGKKDGTISLVKIVEKKQPEENNFKNFSKEQSKDFSGKYRVTVTRILTRIFDKGGKSGAAEICGTIGIRIRGETKSGEVEIRAIGKKSPRVFDVSCSYPTNIKQNSRDEFVAPDGMKIFHIGEKAVDKIREYTIKGEAANDKLIVEIQTNFTETDPINNDEFGWKMRRLFAKDMIPDKEYFVQSKNGESFIYVGFKLEKI